MVAIAAPLWYTGSNNERDRPLTRRQVKKSILKIIAFVGIFILLFAAMTAVFSNHPDFRIVQSIRAFYDEPADSLQGVYIGTSTCYAFWNALVAWKNYGLTVFPYTCAGMPLYATEYVIREVRKTQPDALFIVNINSVVYDAMDITHVHHVLSYMPESEIKAELRDRLCELLDLSWSERLELYVPWIRMRQYWTEYLDEGIIPRVDGLKGASHYDNYLSKSIDLSRRYKKTQKRTPLTDRQVACIEQLLDYCDAEGIRILFVAVPRDEKRADLLGHINTACDLIREHGHEVLYLSDQVAAIPLDLSQDYYGPTHTNIHGAIKFTDYLSEYLIRNYGLEDRRGDPAYASWDAGLARYMEIIAPYVLDIELETGNRDYALAAPRGVAVAPTGAGRAEITWKPVKGAEVYCVYRKAGAKGAWERVAASEACALVDDGLEGGVTYRYTVVPARRSGPDLLYGNFSTFGQSITL